MDKADLDPVVKSLQALGWAAMQATGVILANEQDVTEFMDENADNLELMAKVRYLAMEYSGQQVDEWDSSIDWQATELAQSGVASYHPDHYATVSEFMQSALQGSKLGSGAYYRAKNLVEFVLPYLEQNHISIPDAVLAPGNKSKFELVGEQAKGVIEGMKAGEIAQDEGEARLNTMLSDSVNPDVTVDDFREKHHAGPRRKLPAAGWSYVLPNGQTALLIDTTNPKQYNDVIKALDGHLSLHAGNGTETILYVISQFIPG